MHKASWGHHMKRFNDAHQSLQFERARSTAPIGEVLLATATLHCTCALPLGGSDLDGLVLGAVPTLGVDAADPSGVTSIPGAHNGGGCRADVATTSAASTQTSPPTTCFSHQRHSTLCHPCPLCSRQNNDKVGFGPQTTQPKHARQLASGPQWPPSPRRNCAAVMFASRSVVSAVSPVCREVVFPSFGLFALPFD